MCIQRVILDGYILLVEEGRFYVLVEYVTWRYHGRTNGWPEVPSSGRRILLPVWHSVRVQRNLVVSSVSLLTSVRPFITLNNQYLDLLYRQLPLSKVIYDQDKKKQCINWNQNAENKINQLINVKVLNHEFMFSHVLYFIHA